MSRRVGRPLVDELPGQRTGDGTALGVDAAGCNVGIGQDKVLSLREQQSRADLELRARDHVEKELRLRQARVDDH